MIGLFAAKEKQKREAAAAAAAGVAAPKQAPGQLRLQKDLSELDLPPAASIRFPEGEDKQLKFEVKLRPSEGLYRSGTFAFSFDVPLAYPHDPPKVKCLTKVYHPNIDLAGNVCLNILREDWRPVLSVQSIVIGLNFLLLAPNPDDPLNKEAALAMKGNPSLFERVVAQTVRRGGYVGEDYFPPAEDRGP